MRRRTKEGDVILVTNSDSPDYLAVAYVAAAAFDCYQIVPLARFIKGDRRSHYRIDDEVYATIWTFTGYVKAP